MIKEHIDRIRNAILGKEIKGAIADGLEQAYNDAVDAGSVVAEVSIARGNYSSLGIRLDAEDETIAEIQEGISALKNDIILSSDETTKISDGQILIVYENVE